MNAEPLTAESAWETLREAIRITDGHGHDGVILRRAFAGRLLTLLDSLGPSMELAARSASPVDRAGLTADMQIIAALRAKSWVEDAHGEVVLLSDAEDAALDALRASPVDREDELDRLARFVGRVAGMGLCSQTHHEYIVREAAALAARSKDPSDAR